MSWTETTTGVGAGYSAAGPTVVAASFDKPQGAEVPRRPDECLPREGLDDRVEAYDRALLVELDLAAFKLRPQDRQAGNEPPKAPAAIDPSMFEEVE